MGGLGGCYCLEISTPYIKIVYQNFISENLLIYKLVHTYRGNRKLR